MMAIVANMGGIFSVMFWVLLASPLAAQAAKPDLRGVGLVIQAGKGGCTGTLVAPDLVLTAGHCLTGRGPDFEYFPPDRYTFSPSTSSGVPGPQFTGKSVAVHPIFLILPNGIASKLRRDIGLIRLRLPVPADLATPIPIAPPESHPARGFLLSFRGPGGGAMRQRACPVISEVNQLLVIGCEVVNGESGSPFLIVRDSAALVYGVVSSRFRVKEQPVALSSVVWHGFDGVLAALQGGQRR